MMLGSLLVSLGCSIMTFMASYDNYPGAYALNALHEKGASNCMAEKWVHIDAFTAMNGVSRFSENKYPWRYSKEEGIALEEYRYRNFTYLLNLGGLHKTGSKNSTPLQEHLPKREKKRKKKKGKSNVSPSSPGPQIALVLLQGGGEHIVSHARCSRSVISEYRKKRLFHGSQLSTSASALHMLDSCKARGLMVMSP